MQQIKIFKNMDHTTLEDQVNEFLKQLAPRSSPIDVQYLLNDSVFSVMIRYDS